MTPQAQQRLETHRIQHERLIQLEFKVFLEEAHIPSSVACQLLREEGRGHRDTGAAKHGFCNDSLLAVPSEGPGLLSVWKESAAFPARTFYIQTSPLTAPLKMKTGTPGPCLHREQQDETGWTTTAHTVSPRSPVASGQLTTPLLKVLNTTPHWPQPPHCMTALCTLHWLWENTTWLTLSKAPLLGRIDEFRESMTMAC